MSDDLTVNGLVKWETFQKVAAERDELRRERDTLQQELDRVSVFLSLHGFPGYEMEIHPVSRVTKEPK